MGHQCNEFIDHNQGFIHFYFYTFTHLHLLSSVKRNKITLALNWSSCTSQKSQYFQLTNNLLSYSFIFFQYKIFKPQSEGYSLLLYFAIAGIIPFLKIQKISLISFISLRILNITAHCNREKSIIQDNYTSSIFSTETTEQSFSYLRHISNSLFCCGKHVLIHTCPIIGRFAVKVNNLKYF